MTEKRKKEPNDRFPIDLDKEFLGKARYLMPVFETNNITSTVRSAIDECYDRHCKRGLQGLADSQAKMKNNSSERPNIS